MTRPLKAYQDLLDNGTLDPDPAQAEAAIALETLSVALRGYDPRPKGIFRRKDEPPRGLYFWGGVGVGKSLLMDLFAETVPLTAKRRVHFHAFMQEVHQFMTLWRGMSEAERRRHPSRARGADLDDPIPHVARGIFDEAHLLCFDEFQVTDITDAMLLGRLFDQLFALGAVVVATSNRHPDDLYKDGLNRELFVPFIERLKSQLDIQELKSAKDYRLDRLKSGAVYFSPLGSGSRAQMDQAWAQLTAGATPVPGVIKVGSRTVAVPQCARGVARGSFAHWCGSALGPADYLCLAAEFPTVLLDDVPKMSPENRNEAKRFVTLVDALYEARSILICSADAAPDALYTDGHGAFEFDRTASRLHEMQSESYLALSHIGTHVEA